MDQSNVAVVEALSRIEKALTTVVYKMDVQSVEATQMYAVGRTYRIFAYFDFVGVGVLNDIDRGTLEQNQIVPGVTQGKVKATHIFSEQYKHNRGGMNFPGIYIGRPQLPRKMDTWIEF